MKTVKPKPRRHLFEELRLGRGRIADDANVDVAAQRRLLDGALGHAAEEHQHDAALDLVVAVHGREEAADQVVVQVLSNNRQRSRFISSLFSKEKPGLRTWSCVME